MVEIEKPLPSRQRPDEIEFCSKNGRFISLIAASIRYHSQPVEGPSPNTVSGSSGPGTHRACRKRLEHRIMRGRLNDPEAVRLGKCDVQTSGVAPIDREALEGIMRDDVFLAADGRALAHDSIEFWMPPRRGSRRA